MMQLLKNEETNVDILQELQDPNQANEVRNNDKVYRVKRRMLMIHKQMQVSDYSY